MKFLAGLLTMLFIVSVINCSGPMKKNTTSSMTIIDHTAVQEKEPCK